MIPGRIGPSRPVIVGAVAAAALLSGTGVALAVTSSSSSPPRKAANVDTAAAKPRPGRCQIKLPASGLPLPGRIFAIPKPLPAFGVGPFAFRPFAFGPFGAIHGEFVVPKANDGYQTIDTQRGKVTTVSSSSITVKSADGYTKTYQVTHSTNVAGERAGIGSVKTGQTVSVLATVNGSAATATQIVDFASLPMPPKMPQILKPGSRHVFHIGPCISWGVSR